MSILKSVMVSVIMAGGTVLSLSLIAGLWLEAFAGFLSMLGSAWIYNRAARIGGDLI